MKIPSPKAAVSKPLDDALLQSQIIGEAVSECAGELGSINGSLKEVLVDEPSQPMLETALEQSRTVETKVQACADNLADVSNALGAEIHERHLLEHDLEVAQGQEASARHAALHDVLTSLPNRALFDDRLEHGLAQARRHARILAVMFIDLDGFKAINDTHGHAAGDKVLQAVATRLAEITREVDTVSRQGGDEFLYLLLEVNNESDPELVAGKIIARLAEPCVLTEADDGVSVCVRCSIGIAVYPNDGATAADLIGRADRAMYRAKRNGGGYSFDHAGQEGLPARLQA